MQKKHDFVFYEISSLKLRKKYIRLGIADLKEFGWRGVAYGQNYIVISSHLPIGKMLLESIIHESLHVVFPKAKEKQIEISAHFIAKTIVAYNKASKRKFLKLS